MGDINKLPDYVEKGKGTPIVHDEPQHKPEPKSDQSEKENEKK